MRLRRILAVVITTALILSGCTSLSLDESDILSLPKASGSRAEIQKLIEKDAKGTFRLIYPTSGSYKNGIIQHDVDNDGTEDAIALFTDDNDAPKMLVAANVNNAYQLVGSIPLDSANIKELRFADIDADAKDEVVICFDAGSSSAVIEAYSVEEEITKAKAAEGFHDYVIGDFDGNSSQDILITEFSDNSAKARLMVYSDGSYHEESSCDVDPNVSSFINLRYDTICEDIFGAVADGKLKSGEYSTQLLYYDTAAHLLVNPLYMNESYRESMRTNAVASTDIDSDGVIEVPLCFAMTAAKDEDADTVCSIVRWSGYVPELMSLSTKEEAILCDRLGFSLQLDLETLNGVTARYTDENTVVLYKLSFSKSNEPVIGKEQLRIKRYIKSADDEIPQTESKLCDSSSAVYTCIIRQNAPFDLETVKNGFNLLEA